MNSTDIGGAIKERLGELNQERFQLEKALEAWVEDGQTNGQAKPAAARKRAPARRATAKKTTRSSTARKTGRFARKTDAETAPAGNEAPAMTPELVPST